MKNLRLQCVPGDMTFGCSLAQIQSSASRNIRNRSKGSGAQESRQKRQSTKSRPHRGTTQWTDREPRRFECTAFFDPQSLGRRNKERPCLKGYPVGVSGQTADSKMQRHNPSLPGDADSPRRTRTLCQPSGTCVFLMQRRKCKLRLLPPNTHH
jgi:hypothetical protein